VTGSGGPRARDWRVWLGLAIIYLVWGGTYLAIRVMDRTVPPLLGSSARFLLAGAILSAALLARGGRERMRATPRQLAAAALLGLLLPAGGNGLVTVAERHVPAGLAALIIASVPLWVVLLRRLTGDRIARATAVGVGVGFSGVALLLLPGNRPAGVTAAGLLLVVLAAALWATGTFLSGRLPLPRDLLAATAIEMLIGGVALGAIAIPVGELGDVHPGRFNLGTAWSFVYLVTIGSLLAYSVYTWLLKNVPVSKVATYAYVNPVVAVLLGWWALGEAISGLTVVAAGVIVASVAIVIRTESEPREPVAVTAPARARAEPAREAA
jgi:drug/metabolite transporter (DMT)-like permease